MAITSPILYPIASYEKKVTGLWLIFIHFPQDKDAISAGPATIPQGGMECPPWLKTRCGRRSTVLEIAVAIRVFSGGVYCERLVVQDMYTDDDGNDVQYICVYIYIFLYNWLCVVCRCWYWYWYWWWWWWRWRWRWWWWWWSWWFWWS